ncbi:MAG: hypothetical protein Q8939_18800 [Bacteroidota bacterium]|nr:hypothetical protein [Bacteroidota bacterium]
MKKAIFMFLAVFSVVAVFSQNRNDPPDKVRHAFQRQYPQSQPNQWKHTGETWNVNFDDKDHNNGESMAHFDRTGRHIDTYIPYDDQDVPGPVMDRMQHRYPGSDSYEFTRIERGDGHPIFRVHFRVRRKFRTLYVDESGRERERQYRGRHY